MYGYHHHKALGASLLALGVLFLLRDLGVWEFWNVQWWTALLLLFGVSKLCMGCCCQEGQEQSKKR